MQSLIEQILDANCDEIGRRVGKDKTYNECAKEMVKYYGELEAKLSETDKELLIYFINYAMEKEAQASTLYFAEGFKFAYRLGAEACGKKCKY